MVGAAFQKNKSMSDREAIRTAIDKGKYMLKELEATVKFHKYRQMKKRYYDDDDDENL